MNEEDLRKNLAIAFVHIKEQQDELFEMKNQVAAMRDLMTEASPKFARMFSERMKGYEKKGRALNVDTLAGFDEIILRLRNG